MSKVAMWVRLPIKEGMRDEAVAAFQTAIDNTAAEDGTLHYVLSEDPKEPNVLYVWELYADQAALAAHGGTDAFKAFSASMLGFLGGAPDFKFLAPVSGKGL